MNEQTNYVTISSDKSRKTALILCVLGGWLGLHNFYVGKIGKGIIYLLTFGVFGFGILIDLILILCGTFTDNTNAHLRKW